ncbi:MAG: helix-turn-helix domain-containing protein, partial [Sciscionella sp.]
MTPSTNPSNTSRAPRRDALRNDAVVLQAAREVLAEQGPQASMESIAVRAGLGVGTIYRRFTSKDALLDAIARLFVEEMDQAATWI